MVKDSLFMRVDFCSNLDGMLGSGSSSRPPLDLVFVLDESWSMNSPFPDDSDRRSKLAVAIEGLIKICGELNPSDNIALVGFTTSTTIHAPLTAALPTFIEEIKDITKKLKAGGGTHLLGGLSKGYDLLPPVRSKEGNTGRQLRVVFLTDMESSARDEEQVLELASQKVLDEIASYLTVVGIGVDLAVSTVDAISAIPGARYVSATSAEEFLSTVAVDFNYDVTPIAFDIKMTLPSSLTFTRIYGSAELNSVPRGATTATISTEFPVPLDASRSTNGGIYLCQLEEVSGTSDVSSSAKKRKRKGDVAAKNEMTVTWRDALGSNHEKLVALDIPPLASSSSSSSSSSSTSTSSATPVVGRLSSTCDPGLRKAIILAEYVSLLTKYAYRAKDGISSSESEEGADASLYRLVRQGPKAVVDCEDWSEYVAAPKHLILHARTVREFNSFKTALLAEMELSGDSSLFHGNQNVLQTIDQVIEVESSALVGVINEIKAACEKSSVKSEGDGDEDEASAPRGLMCPISLTIMEDPVIAADGHTYERNSIETWINTHKNNRPPHGYQAPILSPTTNLPLLHENLIPNHALKMVIQDFEAR